MSGIKKKTRRPTIPDTTDVWDCHRTAEKGPGVVCLGVNGYRYRHIYTHDRHGSCLGTMNNCLLPGGFEDLGGFSQYLEHHKTQGKNSVREQRTKCSMSKYRACHSLQPFRHPNVHPDMANRGQSDFSNIFCWI